MWGRRISRQTPVLLRKNSVLAFLRTGQQFLELCSSPQFDKQRIGLKGGVGAIIMLDSHAQHMKSGGSLAAISKDRAPDRSCFLSLLPSAVQFAPPAPDVPARM